MAGWSIQDLETIGDADEIQITTARTDGSLRPYVPIWVVRVGGDLFVRSYRGPAGAWYRHARRHPHGRIRSGNSERAVDFVESGGTPQEAIDHAYRTKYGRYGGSYVDTMVRQDVVETTLRIIPQGTAPGLDS
jgi:hypothetical protein